MCRAASAAACITADTVNSLSVLALTMCWLTTGAKAARTMAVASRNWRQRQRRSGVRADKQQDVSVSESRPARHSMHVAAVPMHHDVHKSLVN
jgi:hypothetical protein